MLEERFAFARLVVGSGNELAAAAARRVAESPGAVYNPLLVRGGAGVGKTHLLHAIGHLALELEPQLAIHLESGSGLAERVTGGLTGAIDERPAKALAEFDLLLIDELEQLAGMTRTQRELAAIAAALLQRGGQLVLASRLGPGEPPDLDEELERILAGGLVVEIEPPGETMRLGIVRQLAAERGSDLPDEVARSLAAAPLGSAAALETATFRLLEIAQAAARPPSAAEVYRVLGARGAESEADEFGAFLTEVGRAVAAAVETAPWRRRIAQAILRWEGEGVRTHRLERALDADTAPDVDRLLEDFERDARRLLVCRRALADHEHGAALDDPDRIAEAEALLREMGEPAASRAHRAHGRLDRWFLDPEKVAYQWAAVEERLLEETR